MTKTIQFTLTVNEGKWLIAYGLRALPKVQEALRSHSILFKGGTTVSCASEVLAGYPMRISGRISQRGTVTSFGKSTAAHTMLLRGGVIENADNKAVEVTESLGCGDVIITGANIFDAYGNAALLAGTAGGGSFGMAFSVMATEGAEMLIAVGLEKFAPGNINDAVARARRKGVAQSRGMACGLVPISGKIFTELEAIKAIADVDVILIGRGGVCGAEGASVFQAEGEEEEIDKLMEVLSGCYGKPLSGEAVSMEECNYPCSGCGRHLNCGYKLQWMKDHGK